MKHILILLCALLGLGSCQSGNSTEIDNRTVQTFDVPRFMGKWHEIARYDHRFEKGMTRVRWKGCGNRRGPGRKASTGHPCSACRSS